VVVARPARSWLSCPLTDCKRRERRKCRTYRLAVTIEHGDGFAMSIDTRHAVEIEASPLKMLALAGLGLFMTVLSAAVAVRAFPNVPPDSSAEFYGYAGTALFAACTLLILWRALTTHGPVVTITCEGIRDSRVAAELIPWSAVNDIATWEYRRQRVMVLTVDPAIEAGLNLTRMVRWTRGANRALGADGLCIAVQGLRIGFDELLATSLAYAHAGQSGAAIAPTHADADAHEGGGARASRVTDRSGLRPPDPRERWDR